MSVAQLKICFTEPSILLSSLDIKSIKWFLHCIPWPYSKDSTHSKCIIAIGKQAKAGVYAQIVSVQATVKVTTEIRQLHKTEVMGSDQPVITLTFRPQLAFLWPRQLPSFILLLQMFEKK